MKRIVLPILLLTISSPAFAMWGWFRKKQEVVPAAVTPTTEATISAVEPEKQEVPATVSAQESESEYVAPEVEKIALGGAVFASARQKEMALIVAINTGDVDKVKQLIDEKVEVRKPFKLIFYAGQTPLEVIFGNDTPKKFEIAELLLTAGANKEDLNRFLQDAVQAEDYEQVLWLVNHGAKDIDGKAFELIEKKRVETQKTTEEPEAVEAVTAKAEKVITPTEVKTQEVKEIAVTPAVIIPVATPAKPAARVILTPLSKPAAAQPRIQEVKVEITSKPKVIITPVRKPAAVQPKPQPRVQEVKVEITPKAPVVKPAAAPIKPAAPIAKAPVVAPEVKKAAEPVLALAQEGPYDSVKLARAISRGDVNTVRAALDAGVSATDTFKSLAFAGLTPVALAFKQNVPNKLAIAELLIVNGAQVADLKPFLADAIKNQNAAEVEWLLNFGVEDADGKGAELVSKK